MKVQRKKINSQTRFKIGPNDILFEDENYIIINKPDNLPVHSTLDKKRVNLHDMLIKYLSVRDNCDQYVGVHHRLDKDTTGAILFTKNKSSNPVVAELFKSRQINKKYIGLANGVLEEKSGVWTDYLSTKKIKGLEKAIKVEKGGKKAITEYEVIEESHGKSLISFNIKTGRMHQIRVQSSLRSAALVGDLLYGSQTEGTKRQMLHAHIISFLDPQSQKEISVTAPIPRDMSDLISSKDYSSKFKYIAFNKPYNVLCQFTGENGDKTLADFNFPQNIYAAGRLDKTSEGLLLLTDDGKFIDKLINPKFNHEKTYWVQVENIPSREKLKQLERGVVIKGYKTKPCKVKIIDHDPAIPERTPPIRKRETIPTCWLEIKITEGKNRQVRRMTAAINHPTLRLIRTAINKLNINDLAPGKWIEVDKNSII